MFHPEEIRIRFIPSSGPGGQNVNKVATTAVLTIDINNSTSITSQVRDRLRRLAGRRINQHGILTIIARRYRTQEQNRMDAIRRLNNLLEISSYPPKPRLKTNPTRNSIQQRLVSKKMRGRIKLIRSRHNGEDV